MREKVLGVSSRGQERGGGCTGKGENLAWRKEKLTKKRENRSFHRSKKGVDEFFQEKKEGLTLKRKRSTSTGVCLRISKEREPEGKEGEVPH